MNEEKEFIRYNLKISKDLHAELTQQAKENKRSLQAEIIQRLEDSLNERQECYIETGANGATTQVILPNTMTREETIIELNKLMTPNIERMIHEAIKNYKKETD